MQNTTKSFSFKVFSLLICTEKHIPTFSVYLFFFLSSRQQFYDFQFANLLLKTYVNISSLLIALKTPTNVSGFDVYIIFFLFLIFLF